MKIYEHEIKDVMDYIAGAIRENSRCTVNEIAPAITMLGGQVSEIIERQVKAKALELYIAQEDGRLCVQPTLPKKRPAYVAQIETERDQWKERARIAEARIEEVIHYLALPKFAGEANNWVNPSDIIARLRADYPIGE